MIINRLRGSQTRSDNVYFANNEQASLEFFIAHVEHNLIKLKLYNNSSVQIVNDISGCTMWYPSKPINFALLYKFANQSTLNEVH